MHSVRELTDFRESFVYKVQTLNAYSTLVTTVKAELKNKWKWKTAHVVLRR